MPTEEIDWVIPASIPFEDLKARDLEECVYWLLEAMGAQDIEWRVGGSGGGASDGGRDLEAKILVPSPDGDLSPKLFWFECKGRKGTLEPEAVKNAAVNAMGYEQVEILVVVTNTTFSNPTVDWAKHWNRSHSRPQIQLWDSTKLEQLISRQPSVALRLFNESLSLQGRLQAMSSRFWNRLEFAPAKVLEDLWSEKESVEIGPLERFALIVNECANRTLEQRPWGAAASREDALETTHYALANIFYLFSRIIRAGANQAPLFKALTYCILIALRHTTPLEVAALIRTEVAERNGVPLPDEVLKIILEPILNAIAAELTDVCQPDCRRISRSRVNELTRDGDDLATYWQRFMPSGIPKEDDNRVLWLEHKHTPCDVGFKVNEVRGCPLSFPELSIKSLDELLEVAERVCSYRLHVALAKSANTARSSQGKAKT
ncbi:restriction endonuclease [Pseudomonas sp. W2-17]|uniref:restriction endonuclease n=1 Tax=Pseudomonas sp. W2-17 TaxID=3058039 RepID=UPI0034E0B231